MKTIFKIGDLVESKLNQIGKVTEYNLLFCPIRDGYKFNIEVKFYNGIVDYYNCYGINYNNNDELLLF